MEQFDRESFELIIKELRSYLIFFGFHKMKDFFKDFGYEFNLTPEEEELEKMNFKELNK